MKAGRGFMTTQQRGYILLIVPVVIIGIVLIGYRMVGRSRTSMRISSGDLEYLKTKFCSQQCVSLGANRIQKALEANSRISPGTVGCGCRSDEGPAGGCETTIGAVEQKTAQACYGYLSKVTQVDLSSSCASGNEKNATQAEKVGYGEIPIFQFAIFYEGPMRITNSPPMEVRGLVHGNDSIYLGPENSLSFSDWITSARTIIAWDRKAGSGSGSLGFAKMDGSGPDPASIVPVNIAHLGLDQVIASWPAWKKSHRVAFADQPNGCGAVHRLSIPIRSMSDNIELIEWRKDSDDDSRRRQKFAWKADLIYKNGWMAGDLRSVAFATDPTVITAAPGGLPTAFEGGTTRVRIYESRELYMAKLIPVDVELLQSRSVSDSIVYLYDDFRDPAQGGASAGGFLLYNGARLVRPLTIASNSRMMVLGDYNVDSAYVYGGKRFPFPAALVNDYMVMLSDALVPSEHLKPEKDGGSRILSRYPRGRYDLNACVMTGNSFNPSLGGNFSNHENLIRFLENWREVSFGFSGSAVVLWNSKLSIKPFAGSSYDPPDRDYSFSAIYTDLDHQPPGAPRLVSPGLLDWEMVRK